MKSKIIFFIIVSLIFIANCAFLKNTSQRTEPFKVKEEVLAEVNGEKIFVKDFNVLLKSLSLKSRENMELKKNILNNYIHYKLVVQDAVKRKIDQNEEYINRLNLIKDELLIYEMQSQIVDEAKEVNNSELYRYYLKNIQRYTQPRQYHLLHIQTKSKKDMDTVLQELKKGVSFNDLAETYSIADSKIKGGDIGFVEIEKMEDMFENAILLLKENEISPVIFHNDLYNIFKLIEIKKERILSYDEIKNDIKNEYILTVAKNNWDLYIENLKRNAKIKINDNILKEIY